MERFNYPNLAAVYAEDAHLMYLLECESYGYKRDQQELQEQQEAEIAAQQAAIERGV